MENLNNQDFILICDLEELYGEFLQKNLPNLIIISGKNIKPINNFILNKPFKFSYLLEKIEEIISKTENIVIYNDLVINNLTKEITDKSSKEIIKLTDKEIEVIRFLLDAKGKIVSKEILLEKVWGYSKDTDSNAVESTIYRLKKKHNSLQNLIIREDGGYYILS